MSEIVEVAVQPSTDLSAVGDELAAPIKDYVNLAIDQNTGGGQTKKTDGPAEISGIREQVLGKRPTCCCTRLYNATNKHALSANATVLYPLMNAPDFGNHGNLRPEFCLITIKESEGLRAVVVHQPIWHNNPMTHYKSTFLQGKPMESTAAALENLLEATALLLNEKRGWLGLDKNTA